MAGTVFLRVVKVCPWLLFFFREKKTLSVLARTPPTKTVVQEYSPASCFAIIHPALGLELPVD